MRDLITYEDAKDLLEYGLEKFYENDATLFDYKSDESAVGERCMMFHIGWYMKDKLKETSVLKMADLDCEYNRNFNHPKGLYDETYELVRRIVPDLIIHKRGRNDNNCVVIEFKKGTPDNNARKSDEEKLVYMTSEDGVYRFKFGFYVELHRKKAQVHVYEYGKEMSCMFYTWVPQGTNEGE